MISISDCNTDNYRDTSDSDTVLCCDSCGVNQVDIYQDEGNYCVDCWQNRTYPNPQYNDELTEYFKRKLYRKSE